MVALLFVAVAFAKPVAGREFTAPSDPDAPVEGTIELGDLVWDPVFEDLDTPKREVMPVVPEGALAVAIEPAVVRVPPGGHAVFAMELTNVSDEVLPLHFWVRPEEWFVVEALTENDERVLLPPGRLLVPLGARVPLAAEWMTTVRLAPDATVVVRVLVDARQWALGETVAGPTWGDAGTLPRGHYRLMFTAPEPVGVVYDGTQDEGAVVMMVGRR